MITAWPIWVGGSRRRVALSRDKPARLRSRDPVHHDESVRCNWEGARRRVLEIGLWAVRIVLAVQVVASGIMQLTANPTMVQMIDDIRAGHGPRLFVGVLAGVVAVASNAKELITATDDIDHANGAGGSTKDSTEPGTHDSAAQARSRALHILDRLVGVWTMDGPGSRGTVRYAWFEDDAFLVQTSDLEGPDAPTRGVEYIGWDPMWSTPCSHFFSSSREILKYAYDLTGDTRTI
jgi:hypothetical protein